MGSLTATGCSLIPGSGDQGSSSGSDPAADQPREVDTDQPNTEAGDLATELGNLGALGDNAEACISVTAVVISGSTLAFLAKIDRAARTLRK